MRKNILLASLFVSILMTGFVHVAASYYQAGDKYGFVPPKKNRQVWITYEVKDISGRKLEIESSRNEYYPDTSGVIVPLSSKITAGKIGDNIFKIESVTGFGGDNGYKDYNHYVWFYEDRMIFFNYEQAGENKGVQGNSHKKLN